MSMFHDEDKLRDYERMALTQSRANEFLGSALAVHHCVNCGQSFSPVTSMGRRDCLIHSEKANAVDVSSYVSIALGTRPANANKKGYHPCCGLSDSEALRFRQLYNSTQRISGCCSADHVSHDLWKNMDDLRDNNKMVARVLDTDDMPGSQRNSFSSLAARLHFLPRKYVLSLFDLKSSYYAFRRLPIPMSHRTASTLGDDEKIKSLMGPNCHIINHQHVLKGNAYIITVASGTLKINVNLRDAYLGMCFDFSIPLETFHAEDVSVMEAQEFETTDTHYIMRRQELYAPEGEADDGTGLPSSMGGKANSNNIIDYSRPSAFVPFVVSSWIDPYVVHDKNLPW